MEWDIVTNDNVDPEVASIIKNPKISKEELKEGTGGT